MVTQYRIFFKLVRYEVAQIWTCLPQVWSIMLLSLCHGEESPCSPTLLSHRNGVEKNGNWYFSWFHHFPLIHLTWTSQRRFSGWLILISCFSAEYAISSPTRHTTHLPRMRLVAALVHEHTRWRGPCKNGRTIFQASWRKAIQNQCHTYAN